MQSPHRPPVWLLGSSGFSARLAGSLGLPFAFAHHFSARNTIPALDLYRESFRPSPVLDAPYALIGVSALAADEEKEARRQVRAAALNMVRLRTGRPGLVPTPEEAEAYAFSVAEQDFIDSWNADVVHGTVDEVRTRLDDLQKSTGADELMLTSHAHSPDLRLRSYELIADAYDLPRVPRTEAEPQA